jgi:hypothetical protein
MDGTFCQMLYRCYLDYYVEIWCILGCLTRASVYYYLDVLSNKADSLPNSKGIRPAQAHGKAEHGSASTWQGLAA